MWRSNLGRLDNQGIHVVNFEFQKNPRIFFANREIKSPKDMVGMKYRIPTFRFSRRMRERWGATPVVVAWSEYPFALRRRSWRWWVFERLLSFFRPLWVCKICSRCGYAYPVEQICFSTQFWNSLSEEDQKVISDAAAQVASHHSERTLDKWEEDKEWLINEGGVTFCDIDRQAFIDATEPLGKELQDEGFFTTKDLYDQTRQFNK